ncbi:hypothetical protein MANES_14G049650v8 [Manihot esculenta]|uniref:Uncharacterized protein n=1 Tax=Manihot esculenta TaxID=3983 RepID=A0ACB7GFU2_MANES|nr:hypothetical protein MANES_14G049650v8 [Manihot esculenta]
MIQAPLIIINSDYDHLFCQLHASVGNVLGQCEISQVASGCQLFRYSQNTPSLCSSFRTVKRKQGQNIIDFLLDSMKMLSDHIHSTCNISSTQT